MTGPDVEAVFRAEYGRAVAVLVRLLGDIDLAEEAVQDAFTTALERWPRTGVPPSISLPSAYGPSVTRTSPSRGRSTVEDSGPCSPPANTQAPASRRSWFRASRFCPISARTSGAGGSPTGCITLSR